MEGGVGVGVVVVIAVAVVAVLIIVVVVIIIRNVVIMVEVAGISNCNNCTIIN